MFDFLQQVIFEVGSSYAFTWLMLLKVIGILASIWVLLRLKRGFFELEVSKKTVKKISGLKTIQKYIRYAIWGVAALLILGILGVPYSEVLGYSFFKVDGQGQSEKPMIVNITVFSLLAVMVIYIGAKLISWFLQRQIRRPVKGDGALDEGRRYAIAQIAKYIIYFLAILMMLGSLGINIGVLTASSAALLVGLGLGMQDIFKDLVGGVVILFEGLVEVDDIVEVGDRVGKVVDIHLRTTEVVTRGQLSILVPNAQFTSGAVINYSHNNPRAMHRVNVSVAYESDMSLVRKLLIECAEAHGEVLKTPKPDVYFQNFGDSGLELELWIWVTRHFERERIMSDLRFAIDTQFRKHSVQIPFPQRDMHLVSDFRAKNESIEGDN